MSTQAMHKSDQPFNRLYSQLVAAQRASYQLNVRTSTAAEPAPINQVRDNGCPGTTQIIQPVAAAADWEACMRKLGHAGLEILLAINTKPGALRDRYLSTEV